MPTIDRALLRDPARLQALHDADLLNTRPEQPFDAVVQLVRALLAVPVVLVTVVTEDRQVFKAASGLGEPWATLRETPIIYSYCQHVVLTGDPLVVTDARAHPLLRDNPAIEEMHAIAYAGMPVTTADGRRLGTMAALDTRPRAWTAAELEALELGAALVRNEVDARLVAQARTRELAELHQQEESLRALTEHSPDVIARFDRELRPLYVNPAAARVIGIEPAQLRGRRLAESGMPPDVLEQWEQCLRTVFDTGRPESLELDQQVPRGRLVTSTRFAPEFDRSGRVEYVVAVTRDITRERRLEAEVSLARRIEAVGHLAGGIAHEYNNLLTSILGNADLLRQDLEPSSPLQESVRDIAQAAERAALRTRQLLAFSQKLVLAPQLVDMNETVRALHPVLRQMVGDAVALELRLASPLGAVRVDPTQLRQAIVDLVMNARQAIEHAHGRIVIATRERDVTDADRELHPFLLPGAYSALAITDNGAGIPPDVLPHVFEPFYSTRALPAGTGLGLATVYGSIKQSGGYVLVESTPGQGSTFEVLLPRVGPGASA